MTRPLLLGGMMGTGKSTVGPRVAALVGMPFVDLDDRVTERAGMSVAEIFRLEGEVGFRQREQGELTELLDQTGSQVIALGGGTLLHRPTRLRALERAVVVTLEAPLRELAARLDVSRETRPLIRGDLEEQLARLLEERAAAYAECHGRVLSVGTLDDVAAAVVALWRSGGAVVAAGARSYVARANETLEGLGVLLEALAPSGTHVVTDENVVALEAFQSEPALRHPCTVLPMGEQSKTVHTLGTVWNALLGRSFDRSGVLVAVGGGVVTDLGGFAAATWHRGVRWIAVPTTLLGMVDASVGGKTGVDHGLAKNAVGAFHHPAGVTADIRWLSTEPERSYRSGLAELVKTALLARPQLLDAALGAPERWIARSPSALLAAVREASAAKAAIVSRDPEERGERAVLNLGHTLGHALEAAGDFDRYTHGEAVALGILAALRVGPALGYGSLELHHAIRALFGGWGLPTTLTEQELETALPLMGLDKKRDGTDVSYIVIEAPGKPRIVRLALTELAHLLRSTREQQGTPLAEVGVFG